MKQFFAGLILLIAAGGVRSGYIELPQGGSSSEPVAVESVGELSAGDREYLARFFARVAELLRDRGDELLHTNRDLATLVDRCGSCVTLGRFSQVKGLGDQVAAPFESFDGPDRKLTPADREKIAAGFRALSREFVPNP